jgi:hypothetical protein
MRKILIVFCVIVLSSPLLAQERTGNIYGNVVDSERNPLPGVTVTLTGSLISPMPAISSSEGRFKFLSLSPSDDYNIKAELQGFKTKIEQGIRVSVGKNVNLTIIMEMTTLAEEVTVTAATPLTDSKSVTLSHGLTDEELQSLPTPRDPWQIANLVPSIIMDRENVGGSESGTQSLYGVYGDNFQQNVFSVDGSSVTDVCSRGMGNTYDFDSIQEVQITVGGNDVTAQTGGIALNMVTKRGGDKMSLGGRIFITDQKFQSDNLTDEVKKEGVVRTNRIKDIRDYGLNFGGPIIKSKAWYWLSVGVQDIQRFNLLGSTEDRTMTVYNGKLNFQLIPANRLEISGAIQRVEGFGGSASASWPLGRHRLPWNVFGNPLIKIQDEHMFGDSLFVSARFSYSDSGYREYAMFNDDNAKIQKYNVAKSIYDEYNLAIQEKRPNTELKTMLDYFNENFLGMSHNVKAGFELAHRTTYKGSRGFAGFNYNYNSATIDITGDGRADIVPSIYRVNISRFGLYNWVADVISAYFRDFVSIGRFNILLGLRYDRQSPKISSYLADTSIAKDHPAWYNNFTPGTAEAILNIFPAFNVPAIDPKYHYTVFSPRLGITWDIQGNGKTIAKLSLSQYGDYMTTGAATYWTPIGLSANIYFYWWNDNGDGLVDYRELYWANRILTPRYAPYRVFDDAGNFIADWNNSTLWSGFDPADPTKYDMPQYILDKDAWYGAKTQEAIFSLERQISRDFGAYINLVYRKFYDGIWGLDYYPDTGHKRSKEDYVLVGYVPNEVGGHSTESAAGRPYYLLAGDQADTPYEYRTRQPDFKQQYYGMELVFIKRFSHNWMLNASLTLQTQKASYGKNGYLDPTNLWALDNCTYAHSMGSGSGRLSQYVFSNWIVKLSGLYRLPYGFNVSLNFTAREGYVIKESFTIYDYTAPNTNNRSVEIYLNKFGNLQLPVMAYADLRIEKELKVEGFGKIYFMADISNILNSSTVNRREQRNLGTYYVYDDPSLNTFVPNELCYKFNEILNPRVLRLGMRFQF